MRLFPLLVAVLIAGLAQAQNSIKSVPSSSSMSILGTSTLHDWESVVEDFTATAMVDGNTIKGIEFVAKVESIKSGKGGMDKNTYKAMDSDKYPEIKFTSDKMMIDGTTVKGSGELTIKGSTNTIPLELSYESWSDDSHLVSGQTTFKMSEYGVEPPKAMMGTIKTGDEVTIKFEINLAAE
jgi:polyisoprenoid-binding protein YceI